MASADGVSANGGLAGLNVTKEQLASAEQADCQTEVNELCPSFLARVNQKQRNKC